jgi:hypothetical protein
MIYSKQYILLGVICLILVLVLCIEQNLTPVSQAQTPSPEARRPVAVIDNDAKAIRADSEIDRQARWERHRQSVSAEEAAQHPERVSMYHRPTLLSTQPNARELASYLDRVEPARVFDTADVSKIARKLTVIGETYREVQPDASVTLYVRAVPSAPVSFTSEDLGEFENGLASITVLADRRGRAGVEWTATPGTLGGVSVLAGSPATSGQVVFSLYVPDSKNEE